MEREINLLKVGFEPSFARLLGHCSIPSSYTDPLLFQSTGTDDWEIVSTSHY